jgi:hypothetical protein
MSKKRKSQFAGKVGSNVQNQKRAASTYGYLQLPKGINVFSVNPNGKATFDIIPYEVTDPKHMDRNEENDVALEESLWYKKPFKIHRNVGVDNDTIVCPTTIGKKCPVCEYRSKRILEKAEKTELDSLKASLRNLYIIIPKGMKDFEEIPHIWDMSQHLFQNLLNDEIEENSDYEVFPDLEDGLTLKVRFVPGQMKTAKPYPEASRIDFVERTDSYDESILEDVPNLDEVLKILSYEEINAKFYEVEEQEEEIEEEEEERSVRKRKTKRQDTSTDNSLTWDDIKGKSLIKLEGIIEEFDLKIDTEDYDDDIITLRKVIAKELDISIPKEKQKKVIIEEEEEEEKPVRRGKNKKKIVEIEDEEDEDEEEQIKTKAKKGKTSTSKDKCPHGHTFGEDVNRYDDCDTCTVWENCIDEAENN